MNTGGYGGRRLTKTAIVHTNDRNQPTFKLLISGPVEKVVSIRPPRIVLRGVDGKQIRSRVSIVPARKYSFRIIDSEAVNGENFHYELKPAEGPAGGYLLTVENTRRRSGRYFGTIKLKTDSDLKPLIVIPVSGDIQRAEP